MPCFSRTNESSSDELNEKAPEEQEEEQLDEPSDSRSHTISSKHSRQGSDLSHTSMSSLPAPTLEVSQQAFEAAGLEDQLVKVVERHFRENNYELPRSLRRRTKHLISVYIPNAQPPPPPAQRAAMPSAIAEETVEDVDDAEEEHSAEDEAADEVEKVPNKPVTPVRHVRPVRRASKPRPLSERARKFLLMPRSHEGRDDDGLGVHLDYDDSGSRFSPSSLKFRGTGASSAHSFKILSPNQCPNCGHHSARARVMRHQHSTRSIGVQTDDGGMSPPPPALPPKTFRRESEAPTVVPSKSPSLYPPTATPGSTHTLLRSTSRASNVAGYATRELPPLPPPSRAFAPTLESVRASTLFGDPKSALDGGLEEDLTLDDDDHGGAAPEQDKELGSTTDEAPSSPTSISSSCPSSSIIAQPRVVVAGTEPVLTTSLTTPEIHEHERDGDEKPHELISETFRLEPLKIRRRPSSLARDDSPRRARPASAHASSLNRRPMSMHRTGTDARKPDLWRATLHESTPSTRRGTRPRSSQGKLEAVPLTRVRSEMYSGPTSEAGDSRPLSSLSYASRPSRRSVASKRTSIADRSSYLLEALLRQAEQQLMSHSSDDEEDDADTDGEADDMLSDDDSAFMSVDNAHEYAPSTTTAYATFDVDAEADKVAAAEAQEEEEERDAAGPLFPGTFHAVNARQSIQSVYVDASA